ncbi:MAG: beta-N-acetylhexosaminidase [Ilumatobacter sp.]|nr:beta-N-acetylhexosaminidase [Ilumatobacter sp.]
MPASPTISLLPQPRQVEVLPGSLALRRDAHVVVHDADTAVHHVAEHLVADLQARAGLHLALGTVARAGDIEVRRGPVGVFGDEAYELHIDHHGVRVTAPTAHGLWNATRTLLQLVPDEGAPPELPAIRIVDAPRFEWRGVMLDVARHFFGVDQITRLIELIASVKLNRLHVHLTDDQGWRLEIPAYPDLAVVGGAGAAGGDPGGWFTLDAWREICRHAERHHVTVVPEIDLPGHTHAALSALPWLNPDGMAPAPYTGSDVGFSTLHLGLPETREFVEEVITTVASVSGPYLHIGGDEAASTEPADYAAWVELLHRTVARHGRTMVGWEEVAPHPLPPGTLVQHWLRPETALAAPPGARFVMSPSRHTYLDMRHDPTDPRGRRWAGDIDVDTAYEWDPAGLLPGVDDDRIAGVEAALWTERVTTFEQVQLRYFPRLLCLAEVGWTPQRLRSFAEFAPRLTDHAERLRRRGVAVHPSVRLHGGDTEHPR